MITITKKYRRLFAVVVIPLLVCGVIFAELVAVPDIGRAVHCAPIGPHIYCGALHSKWVKVLQIRKDVYNGIYQVHMPEVLLRNWSKNISFGGVYAAPYPIRATIVDVAGLNTPRPTDPSYEQLKGKYAFIRLGEADGATKYSIVRDHSAPVFGIISTDDLWIADEPNTYSIVVDSSRFTISPDDRSKNYLDSLKGSIAVAYDDASRERLLARIICYPFFVVLFILLSAVGYICLKAYRFIQAA